MYDSEGLFSKEADDWRSQERGGNTLRAVLKGAVTVLITAASPPAGAVVGTYFVVTAFKRRGGAS